MTIRKRGTRYHYDFMIRRHRYRGALPEARTKAEAQQAEAKIKNKIFERKFGKPRPADCSRSLCVQLTYPGPKQQSVPVVTMYYTQKSSVATWGVRI
jgi:hypothetical protein